MADSNIGSLPQAANLDDDSLLVAEQQGQAVKVTGAQFKEFGRQAVVGQVQSYVDQAEAAANRAADAASAVTDMTVEAHPSETPTVTKTTKNGKVNLAFGLPRGEQGVPGPEGKTGPRGPQGAPGNGLTILGHYDTEAALRAAVPNPAIGDAYSVGTERPYDTYIFDGATLDWKNYGPLSGGGGGVLPENVVTAEGGASMEFPVNLGDGPHIIQFTEEEEPPLTAEDIQYSGTETVKQAIDGLKSSVSDGKALVASAITDKGVPTAQDATFAQMAENIGQISGGGDTSDATATSFDILAPKTAYTAAGKVEGVIPTLLGQTIVPGTADKTIANGQYLGGAQIIKGDPNLTSGNIKKGVTLFGVDGALESSFQATLTVTADTGAVVTATHTNGTKVEALSTTGTVVLELPLEGTWKVTAVRGVAQYNTVTIQVSSSYSAELTAAVHIEYFAKGTPLDLARIFIASTTVGDFAIFAGGATHSSYTYFGQNNVDSYDSNLTHNVPEGLTKSRYYLAATTIGSYALFGGGVNKGTSDGELSNTVDVYNESLTHSTAESLSEARRNLVAATIGDYALFGGGSNSTVVDAYNTVLTRSTSTPLATPSTAGAAASNENYALFAGDVVNAYDSNLTRSTVTGLSVGRSSKAAKAGSYILFGGGGDGTNYSNVVDAYDLFLTRTTPESFSMKRSRHAVATIRAYALFGGGQFDQYTYLKTMEAYDPFLVHTTPESLSQIRCGLAAAAIGDYALFGGGEVNSTGGATAIVDVYRYV